MSNFSTLTSLAEGYTGSAPNPAVAATPDSYATITTPGYLNDRTKEFKANDILFINYDDQSVSPLNPGENATLGQFVVTVSNGDTSLAPAAVPYYIGLLSYIGGSASFTLDVDGMVSGDVVYVMVQNTFTSGAYLLRASAQADGISVIMSVDPGISNYSVMAFHTV